MIPDTITDRAVALSFSRTELETRGISGDLTEAAAHELVQEALRACGKTLWSEISIEVYEDDEGYLLLAHPAQFGFVCFRFSEFEELLSAVSLCPAPLPSFLTYDDGDYLLVIRRGIHTLPAPLYEFADSVPCSALEAAHRKEHDQLLIARDAMAVLLEKFSPAPLLFS